MKKTIITGVFLLICHLAWAQKSRLDSLLVKIDKTADPEKVYTISDEIDAIPQGNIALLKKGRQDLAKAQTTGTIKAREHALLMITRATFNLHYTPELLAASLQGERISRDLKDYRYLDRFLHMAGLAYTYQQDMRKSCSYELASAKVGTAAHDTIDLLFAYSNLESACVYLKLTDSAAFYARSELRLVSRLDSARNYDLLQLALGDYGEVMSSVNKLDSALLYYHRAYQIAKSHVKAIVRPFLENNIAKTYMRIGKPDSAAKYALEAYRESANANTWEFTAGAAAILAKIFEGRDDKKSIFYLKAQMIARDSINANEKARQFDQVVERDRQHEQDLKAAREKFNAQVRLYVVIAAAIVLLAIGIILWRNNRKQRHTNKLLNEQKEEIASQRDHLGVTLEQLKSTQAQLIQSEKMASLGELVAGIAHEIQNPLNFVNNFSEVNAELVDEMQVEIEKGNLDEIKAVSLDIKENSKKINIHGKRADAIVKGMLQHSKTGSGTKEPTNINALADECMRVAYHGLSAKDKNFNAEMVTHFDTDIPKINVIPQDIVRVMLNLFNNAFYAVNQKQKKSGADYKPAVTVTSSTENGQVIIKVKDNGVGIPEALKDKIMQPFFTTKPTGEGTGLGLSLTYDMVVKGHGGSIQVSSTEGNGSEFIIKLPFN